MSRFTRRRFLQDGTAWAAGIAAMPSRILGQTESVVEAPGETSVDSLKELPKGRSTVVLIRHRDAVTDDGRPDAAVLRHMLNQAVQGLLEEEGSAAAWHQLIGNADVIGVKTNTWRRLRTPPELESAIREQVIAAGVPSDSVAVDDRGVRTNPVFQRMLSSVRGAMINVRPMRTHHWSGLGTCLKNPIMLVPRPADYHGDACASIGAFWQELGLREKTKLNILVMLTPQFHGVGPHSFSERFVWPYRGLIVGIDPVAVDATGARIIEAKRREYFGEERPISPPPHHIRYADTRYRLGVSDPERIEITRIGWQGESLI